MFPVAADIQPSILHLAVKKGGQGTELFIRASPMARHRISIRFRHVVAWSSVKFAKYVLMLDSVDFAS
jgi:hypothetical protein